MGAVTHVILLCGASVPLGAMHFARPKTSHRGAICARSLVSKLTDSLRLIMCSKSHRRYGIFIENMLNASQVARNELPSAA